MIKKLMILLLALAFGAGLGGTLYFLKDKPGPESNFVPMVKEAMALTLKPVLSFDPGKGLNLDQVIGGRYRLVGEGDLDQEPGQHTTTIRLADDKNNWLDLTVTYEVTDDNQVSESIDPNGPVFKKEDGTYGYQSRFYQWQAPVRLRQDYLELVNKEFHYDPSYVPQDLVDIDGRYLINPNLKVRKAAYEAYLDMRKESEQEGLDLNILSAYRSYAYQESLFNDYYQRDPQGADTYSARPGFSEHQSGLAIDFVSGHSGLGDFAESLEAQWLNKNAARFGFILRYPKGKEAMTGYQWESWHFRYVGPKVAQEIKELGLTLDEYYVNKIDHSF